MQANPTISVNDACQRVNEERLPYVCQPLACIEEHASLAAHQVGKIDAGVQKRVVALANHLMYARLRRTHTHSRVHAHCTRSTHTHLKQVWLAAFQRCSGTAKGQET